MTLSLDPVRISVGAGQNLGSAAVRRSGGRGTPPDRGGACDLVTPSALSRIMAWSAPEPIPTCVARPKSTQTEHIVAQPAVPIPIQGLAHLGIRVHDLQRAVAFYELLGFTKTAGPLGPEPVAILEHPCGLEINLVLNAASATAPNLLMDVPEKHPGITHF